MVVVAVVVYFSLFFFFFKLLNIVSNEKVFKKTALLSKREKVLFLWMPYIMYICLKEVK